MTMTSLEILTQLEFEFRAENYPHGCTPQQALELELELEQASQDPHEYIAMPDAVTAVNGRVLRGPQRICGWREGF